MLPASLYAWRVARIERNPASIRMPGKCGAAMFFGRAEALDVVKCLQRGGRLEEGGRGSTGTLRVAKVSESMLARSRVDAPPSALLLPPRLFFSSLSPSTTLKRPQLDFPTTKTRPFNQLQLVIQSAALVRARAACLRRLTRLSDPRQPRLDAPCWVSPRLPTPPPPQPAFDWPRPANRPRHEPPLPLQDVLPFHPTLLGLETRLTSSLVERAFSCGPGPPNRQHGMPAHARPAVSAMLRHPPRFSLSENQCNS